MIGDNNNSDEYIMPDMDSFNPESYESEDAQPSMESQYGDSSMSALKDNPVLKKTLIIGCGVFALIIGLRVVKPYFSKSASVDAPAKVATAPIAPPTPVAAPW